MSSFRLSWSAAALATSLAADASAVDVPNVGGETLTIDVSNTSELGYHFDNRNEKTTGATLLPEQHVDDDYGDWLNRLYLRTYYWKFSLGVRLDSAVYFHTLDRERSRELILDKRAERGIVDPNANLLALENDFARELHSRYTHMIYPAKLWLGFKHDFVELTAGDFYEQLGRGLVFSVRKLDEVGIDTTVRGGKVKLSQKWDGFRVEATVFGGQLNPLRLDFATGRVLHGAGSPLFFGFPDVRDFEFYSDEVTLATERAKPSYIEDNVVGAGLALGPKAVELSANTAFLLRGSKSDDQFRCIDAAGGDPVLIDDCRADFAAFSEQEQTRSHDQIRNFGAGVRVPPVADTFDMYVEAAGQQQTDGRAIGLSPDGGVMHASDVSGYAVYANVNLRGGIFAATLEGKHYRSFFPLGANVDLSTQGFGAPELATVTYSQPPTTESIYVETLGSRDVCVSGGRGRLNAHIHDHLNVYGWLGRWVSWSEINTSLEREVLGDDDSKLTCTPDGADPSTGISRSDVRRTDTWDVASGGEIDTKGGKSHYWAWLGARVTDRDVPVQPTPEIEGDSATFYREGYVRYDLNQHLAGDFSLAALGYHRRRYEPDQQPLPWHEGENLLALNWNPHFAFVFGYEYQTRPGIPTHYFNGAIQYRSKDNDSWYGMLTDSIRFFVGQRRSALRCVGGVCRVFPAFEGAKLELVSRF